MIYFSSSTDWVQPPCLMEAGGPAGSSRSVMRHLSDDEEGQVF